MLQDKLLEDLKKELKTNKDIEDIAIFGSAARTNFQKYNDIDVLIVLKNAIDNNRKINLVNQLESKYNIKILPLFDYMSGFVPKIFNYFSAKLPFHIFYTYNSELMDPIIGNIKEEKISLGELDSTLVKVS